MYQITFHLKSLSPYIQNNPEGSIDEIKNKTAKTPIGKIIKDPMITGHKNDSGFYIPSKQIRGSMITAAQKIKLGKGSIQNILKACVFFETITNQMLRGGKPIQTPDFIYNEPIFKMGKKSDMVFNPRVAFNDWEVAVKINVLEDSIPKEKIDEVLNYAGLYVGIGSRRPEYGRFIIVRK